VKLKSDVAVVVIGYIFFFKMVKSLYVFQFQFICRKNQLFWKSHSLCTYHEHCTIH